MFPFMQWSQYAILCQLKANKTVIMRKTKNISSTTNLFEFYCRLSIEFDRFENKQQSSSSHLYTSIKFTAEEYIRSNENVTSSATTTEYVESICDWAVDHSRWQKCNNQRHKYSIQTRIIFKRIGYNDASKWCGIKANRNTAKHISNNHQRTEQNNRTEWNEWAERRFNSEANHRFSGD